MADHITGQTIEAIRDMTDGELEAEGWADAPTHQRPVVLELENGTKLYASRDEEGNGPGAMFGETPKGELVFVRPPRPGAK